MSKVSRNLGKIALGTVQFGLSYGIANFRGKINEQDVTQILTFASRSLIKTLDTAANYGESEAVLGSNDLSDFDVITKLPRIDPDIQSLESTIQTNIQSSLDKLGVDHIYGVLLHNPSDILVHGKSLHEILTDLKREGIIKKLGISIYSPTILPEILPLFQPDIVQAPFNVVDRSMVDSGWLQVLKNNGIEFHARSVFLQGLLLMEAEHRPNYFKSWEKLFASWDKFLIDNNLTNVEACLSHALFNEEIDRIVIGIDCLDHLKEIVNVCRSCCSCESYNFMRSSDSLLINPSNWKL